ncbi:MAG: ribonuclease P protein component [Longimicrobiales bacterium]
MSAETPDGRNRLPRTRRLSRGPDILAVLRRGKRSGTVHLDVFHSSSPVSRLRLGWVVPKLGHNSVERNLVKRRIREILRQDVAPRLLAQTLDLDVLVRAKRNTYDAAYGELRAELVDWTDRVCSRVS